VAVRHDRDVITAHDLDEARDRILLGRRDASNALLPEEKHSVAVHESGHALVALLLRARRSGGQDHHPPGRPRPRGHRAAAGRRAAPLPRELPAGLPGRPAGGAGLGAPRARRSVDGGLQRPGRGHRLAINMVRDWGLSPRLGPIGFSTDGPGYLDGQQQFQSRPYSEGTQQVIDEEVSRLLGEAEQRATAVLTENRAALDAVIALLLDDRVTPRAIHYAGCAEEDQPSAMTAAMDEGAEHDRQRIRTVEQI
jgi:cell division protease FtsH